MKCQGRHLEMEAELQFIFVTYAPPKPGGFYAIRVKDPHCKACGEVFRYAMPTETEMGPSRVSEDWRSLSTPIVAVTS